MPTPLSLFVLLACLLLAGLMGYAIQRGATCTVAAVDEIVTHRRTTRLRSMVEAALWVGAGLLLARALGVLPHAPQGHAVGWQTVLGGTLLGGGAYVNRACVFGAIARLSSGEWAYAATPVGYFMGCLLFLHVVQGMSLPRLDQDSPVLRLPMWVIPLAAGLLISRVVAGLWVARRRHRLTNLSRPWVIHLGDTVWSPGPATTVIGVTFFFMMLLAGPWAYTEVLADLARAMPSETAVRALLAAALFSGAGVGGWTAGKWRRAPLQPVQVARCFIGGGLMAVGSLFIPGGNDGLILVGMPLLWPYAWIAFGTMCLTIAALMHVRR
jgi:hypothetical protein